MRAMTDWSLPYSVAVSVSRKRLAILWPSVSLFHSSGSSDVSMAASKALQPRSFDLAAK